MAFEYTLLFCAVAALVVACAALYSTRKKYRNYISSIDRKIDKFEREFKKSKEQFEAPAEKLERAVVEGMASIFGYTVETARQEGVNDVDE